jgi:hypothetical protein
MNVVHNFVREALQNKPIFDEDMETITELTTAICGPMGNIDPEADLKEVTLVADGLGKIWYGDIDVSLIKVLSAELGISVYTE